MESLVINRIRRHLLLLDIISHEKSCKQIVLEDIYWLYFTHGKLATKHLLSLAMESR